VARVREQRSETGRKERIREAELKRLHRRAATLASIVVRLPRDPSQMASSRARSDLLMHFGLTAAMQADGGRFHDEPVPSAAETVDHYAMWFSGEGPHWTRDEFYMASHEELTQIAAEELERARLPGARPPFDFVLVDLPAKDSRTEG
jgi:hypothetical protein